MDLNGIKKVVVTREFQWKVFCHEKYYIISDIFTISLDEIRTEWQMVLYREDKLIFANLHLVEAFSDDFIVNLVLNRDITKMCDGHNFEGSWIRAHRSEGDITLDFNISLERKSQETSNSDSNILSNYEKLFNSEILSDFKFVCSDGKEIPAHNFLLIAHSPVMYKMLMAPMIESKTHTSKLDDIDGETMLEVLRFLYMRKVENTELLTPNLLYCAEKYQIDELKSFVARSMIKMINTDNVLEYFTLADRHKEKALLEACLYYIKRNYCSLREHDDWKKVEKSDANIKLLFELISSDNTQTEVSILKTFCTKYESKLPEEYKKFP